MACTLAQAIELEVKNTDIYLSGEIEYEDEYKLSYYINTYPHTNRIVITESPGGNLYSGIQMGKIIRKEGLETHVTDYCASACNHIFAGGYFRNMNKNAWLGLHVQSYGHEAGYYTKDELQDIEQTAANSTMWSVYHYLKMGISVDVVDIMTETSFRETYYMYKQEAKNLNFVNKD